MNFIKFTEIGIQFLSRKPDLPDFFSANFRRNKVTAKQYTKVVLLNYPYTDNLVSAVYLATKFVSNIKQSVHVPSYILRSKFSRKNVGILGIASNDGRSLEIIKVWKFWYHLSNRLLSKRHTSPFRCAVKGLYGGGGLCQLNFGPFVTGNSIVSYM